MTTLQEAAQQALEALEMFDSYVEPLTQKFGGPRVPAKASTTWYVHRARDALRAALAQQEQEQEPVAWMLPGSNAIIMAATKVYRGALAKYYTQPLYTTPPRREWRGLTMQEINALPEIGGVMWRMGTAPAVLRAIRAVERALKEKNNG